MEPKPDTSAAAATIRIRINHSHTLKEGWRLSETTVEIVGDPHQFEDHRAWLDGAMRDAHELGIHEANRRRLLEAS